MNKLGLITRNKWTPYFYVLPVVILILFVFVFPLVSIFRYSLISQQGEKEVFVGLANFQFISSDFIFWKALENNLTLLLVVPILTVISLLVAISLYERVRGWGFYRSLIFMPFVLPSVVIGIVFIYLLEKDGIINTILQAVGLKFLALDWLGNANMALPTLMGIITWRELGFGVVLLLAAMLALPEELNEAAKLDGANWFQEHIYVTIPQLKPVLTFFIVNEAITMISWVFGYVYVVTGGGPGFATTVLELYIWKYAFAYRAYGVASAVAVILLLITFGVMMFGLRGIFDEGEQS
ncbi:MAG: sugar ABC transporter permease [Negativicutes bacterium]|jgi:ABC-type sugar transport system permease subunit|nr:sugar ABC transporter permease [Negativicutes bacterium]